MVAPPMLRCWGCRALDRHLERPPGLAHAHAVLADNRSRHRRPRDCRDSSCLKSGSTLLADQSTRHKAARLGPIYRRESIATSRSALAGISTEPATWSNGSSIRSNSVGGSRCAMITSRPIIWSSSSSHQYGCGCALMSHGLASMDFGADGLVKSAQHIQTAFYIYRSDRFYEVSLTFRPRLRGGGNQC